MAWLTLINFEGRYVNEISSKHFF